MSNQVDYISGNSARSRIKSASMNFQMHTDISRLCRICLKDADGIQMEYIYKSPDSARPCLHTMLSAICAPVFDSEDIHEQVARESFGMPKAVCQNCKRRILAAYDLYEACIEGDRKLWEMIIIQKELIDEEDTKQQPRSTARSKPQNEDAESMSTEEPSEANKEDTGDKDASANKDDTYRNSTILTCDLCSASFKSKKNIRLHMKESHAESIKPCDQCDEIFVSEVQMEDHILYHRTGKKFSCVVCKKRFATTTAHRLHARTHVNFTPFQCDQCDKSFSTSSALQLHLTRHTGQRDIACELCPLRFYTKGSLKLHMITHTKEQKYACDICDSRFTTRDSLIIHTKKHTGERPFSCTECSLTFVTSGNLKRHMRTHTGEKPYKCAYCNLSFRDTTDLLRHSRSHVGDKPYRCDICTESFRLVAELRTHYSVHFKPGEKGATEIMEKLKRKYQDNDGSNHFTISQARNRRYKLVLKEKKIVEEMETDDDGSSKPEDADNANGDVSTDDEEKIYVDIDYSQVD